MKYWYDTLGRYVTVGGKYPYCAEHPCCGTGTGTGTCVQCNQFCTDCFSPCVVVRFHGLTGCGGVGTPIEDFEIELPLYALPQLSGIGYECIYALASRDTYGFNYDASGIDGPCEVGFEFVAFRPGLPGLGGGWSVTAPCTRFPGVQMGGPRWKLDYGGDPETPHQCLPVGDEELELLEEPTSFAWFCGFTEDGSSKVYVRRGDCSGLPPDILDPNVDSACVGRDCTACVSLTPAVMKVVASGFGGSCGATYNSLEIELTQDELAPCTWKIAFDVDHDIECFPLKLVSVELIKDTVSERPRTTIRYNFIFNNGSVSHAEWVEFDSEIAGATTGTNDDYDDCFAAGQAFYSDSDLSFGSSVLTPDNATCDFDSVCESAGTA